MQKVLLFSIFLIFQITATQKTKAATNLYTESDILSKASQALLLAVKKREPVDSLIQFFQKIEPAELVAELNTDRKRKAFWLNIYNAYTQLFLAQNPDQYKKRSQFFGNKKINIAGELLSLDRIEHGILRRSKTKWSMGYVNRLFPSGFEKSNRVDSLDYRIHFALNCGAKSCPPIAFYKADQLDKQLDLATKIYLKSEASYDASANHVALPAIMGWFRGDFGGKKKMKELLKKTGVIPTDIDPSVSFKKYDWNLYLDNYKTD